MSAGQRASMLAQVLPPTARLNHGTFINAAA